MSDLSTRSTNPSRGRIWALWALLCTGCTTIPPTVDEALAKLPDGPAEVVGDDAALRERLESAEAAIEGGHGVDRAIDDLRALTGLRPRLLEARLLLARALVARLDADKERGRRGQRRLQSEEWIDTVLAAELAARGVLRYDDKSHEAWTELGRVHEADGHLEAALVDYERALDLGSPSLRTTLAAARVAIDLGHERAALRHLEALRRRAPRLPSEVLLWEARCYLTLQDSMRREAMADSTRASNRKTYLARARRAFDELAQRDPVEASTVSGQAYCRYTQIRAGDIDKSKANIDAMRELYQRAARMEPGNPQARFDLAVILESDLVGNPEAARAMYESALQRDPEHLPSLLNLARILWRGETDRERAVAIWKRALPRLAGREARMVRALLAQSRSEGG